MSSFPSWLKPMSQEEEAEIRRCLKERSQRLETSGYDATRDGPRDVALALQLGELLRQDSVKEWCNKDGPEAADFAKTYLDLLQDSWGSPVAGLFKISTGLSGAAGPLAPISQYLRSGFSASRDVAATSQHRLAVDSMPPITSDQPRGLQSGTVQSQHDMDTLSNKELVSGMGKNLWDIARMAKFALSPRVLKFLWHIRRRDAELTARELEVIRVEMNEVLLKSTKEDGPDSANRAMLEHLNETFREMTETILKSQEKQETMYTSSSYDPTLEVKRFSSVAWMSAVVLLSLPYFQRAWIVQELAFARENTMVWGSQVFVWKDIQRATKYLSSNNAWALLRREVDAFKPMWDHLESQSSKLGVEPLSSAIELHIMVKNLAFKTPSPDSPYKLLMAGRLLQAKDHRDKFFAMLDLAKTSAQRLGTPFPNFKPDYKKSIEQVIKEFTVEFIKAKGDLTILTQVEDRSLRNKRTLPSWMPDYTAALLPFDLLGISQKKRWKADGGAQRDIKIVAANSVLAVYSHKEDTIQATAVNFNNIMANGDWRSVLALTKSLCEMDGPYVDHPADDRLLSALLCSSSMLKIDIGLEVKV
ncbi:unnamed protein product [Clonostachys rosea]|uniref:Heterokaryon incompatibility domain-containing protein n=1 Tax=Bionectria ochroleuca TaxID=29856 RepID=A0ABY6UD23_BIOOC|nr:unnamed protein product [Clonostachys rosea]